MNDFFQEEPTLGNQYLSDKLFKSYINKNIPSEFLNEIEKDLEHLGNRVISDILEISKEAESNLPVHVPFDPWGKRIDKIKVSKAWEKLDKISAEEGMISIGYERKYNEFSRIYQFAKLYLFNPSSAIYTCPLAMTDGAAKLIEVYGNDNLKNNVFNHLTSNIPNDFWTSGQWMTEKTGGSDVAQTQTIAKFENGEYKLYGTKWFTSATTSQVAFTLARIEENGEIIEGSKGLSVFCVKTHDDKGNLNNIIIHRLKDKLGTKALPTAELTLQGTKADLVGGVGDGIKKISTLFNVTRIYNATTSVAFMRRAIALSRDYANKRIAFGKRLNKQPLHIETIANMEIEFQSAFHAVFYTVSLLGKEENNKASEDDKIVLRLLTPLIKLYTAKQSIKVISEVLESFGGAGYVEDTGLPKMLRDAQVLSIWEGTTNVLSLDVLRAISKENAFIPFMKNILNRIENISDNFKEQKIKISKCLEHIKDYLIESSKQNRDFSEAGARNLSYSLIKTFMASLLVEYADEAKNDKEFYSIVAIRWCNKNLDIIINADSEYRDKSELIAFYQ